MGKPVTLLERLCAHALSFDAQCIGVEHKGSQELVSMMTERGRIRIASFPTSGSDAEELLGNLYAAAKKPIRSVLHGKVYVLKTRGLESNNEDAFEVMMELAPKLDPSAAPSFTAKQGQYLAFIYNYTRMHRMAPAESDLERYFRVSAPSIHDMIKTLERNGLIEKTPGQARSIRLLVPPEHIPRLG